MSILIGQDVRQGWAWTDARLNEFANSNFSDEMMLGLSRQNQLRLANRSQSLSLRSRIIAMHYLPFGLIPARATRTNTQFQHYATNKSVSRYSFGGKRFDFFFHQLANSDWIRLAASTQQFAVAVSDRKSVV
jgi:hypothetical protein